MKKPTKTEYKGTVYRSKTEAIFARCLDLSGYEFRYEYRRFADATGGYLPDFYIANKSKSRFQQDFFIVEIKPSIPTETYKNKLAESFKKISSYKSGNFWPWSDLDHKFIIFAVNWWDCEMSYDRFYSGGSWGNCESSKVALIEIMNMRLEAMKYRFDLQHCDDIPFWQEAGYVDHHVTDAISAIIAKARADESC